MRILIYLIVALTCVNAMAQDDQEKSDLLFNEIRLNAGYLLAGIPEISYERILSDETAVGVSIVVVVDTSINYNFGITPYGRFYFGKKRAAGFFLEANSAIYSAESDGDLYINGLRVESGGSKLGFGFGLGLGGKFLTKGGWVGELLVGVGRNFLNKEEIDEAYPRLGISIGRRF